MGKSVSGRPNKWAFLSPEGRVSRGGYLLTGAVLFGLKLLLDTFAAAFFPDSPVRRWGDQLSSPFIPALHAFRTDDLPLALILCAIAIPFIWIGMTLTINRLADAGLSSWWSLFFFIPWVNLVLFAVLTVVPSAGASSAEPGAEEEKEVSSNLDWFIVLFVIVPVAVAGFLLVMGAVYLTRSYGWGMFLGIPFLIGAVTTWLADRRKPGTRSRNFWASFFTLLATGALLCLFAQEGAVCLIMAFPLAVILALIGSECARSCSVPRKNGRFVVSCSALVTALIAVDLTRPAIPPLARFQVSVPPAERVAC